MKRRKRPFLRGIINHCYQPSADGGILFYCYSDYLVWFTIVCVSARKHQIKVLALCPMPDHIHLSVIADSSARLSRFMRDINRAYAAHFHGVSGRTGPVFRSTFGSVPKSGLKTGRTNLVYVWNNPTERQLAAKAEEYRWNFLAYAISSNPFSKKLIIRRSRRVMQEALKEVRLQFLAGEPLNYAQLQRLFSKLNTEESQQLTDFIISTYNVIDYQAAIAYFDSYEDLLTTVHSATSREYDLNEVFIGKSDAHYKTMSIFVMREYRPKDIHDILSLPLEKKVELFRLLRKHTTALDQQIAKFLHIPIKKSSDAATALWLEL